MRRKVNVNSPTNNYIHKAFISGTQQLNGKMWFLFVTGYTMYKPL